MDLGSRWEVGPFYQRAPRGPPGPAKYVGLNETNYLTIQYETRHYSFIISFWVFYQGLTRTAVSLSLVTFIATNQPQNVSVSNNMFIADETAA